MPDLTPAAPALFASIRNLVFDLDGTLIDSSPGIAKSLALAFASVGRTLRAPDVQAAIGPPIAEIARRLEPGLSPAEVAGIEGSYRAVYDSEGWRATEAYPAAASTLRTLAERGFAIFIVTNKPLLPATRILDLLALQPMVKELVTRDSRVPSYASKSAMLGDLLSRRELDAGETLMVGDTFEDEQAARANQVAFVHARYGYSPLHASRHGIDTLAELATLLLESQAVPSRRGLDLA